MKPRWESETDVESLVFFQPALDSFMLCRGVVVADQINVFVCGDGLIDHAQEAQPLLMAVLLLAQTVDLAIGVLSAANKVVVPFRL